MKKTLKTTETMKKIKTIKTMKTMKALALALAMTLLLTLTLSGCGTKYELDKTAEFTQFHQPPYIGLSGEISDDHTSVSYGIRNHTDDGLTCGIDNDFIILKEEDGHWYPLVSKKNNDIEDIAVLIAAGATLGQSFDWTDLYGSLEDGNYRLVKTVYHDSTPFNLYFQFDINGQQITYTTVVSQ